MNRNPDVPFSAANARLILWGCKYDAPSDFSGADD